MANRSPSQRDDPDSSPTRDKVLKRMQQDETEAAQGLGTIPKSSIPSPARGSRVGTKRGGAKGK